MEIGLIHAGLAAGAALAALPVILHLFMRQTPKKIVFPALQLIKERQKRSRKRLRVKNWLLLLARMALLALMALALARPTFVTETSSGDQDVPSAIGLVFDTSLSMGYTERDLTRLDEAKARAREILSKAPTTSMVFVIDSADPVSPTGLSPAGALKQVDSLSIRSSSRPLNLAVGKAYSAVSETDKPRREVYVLTDLARSAWAPETRVEGLDKAIKSKINTFVLRLAPVEVRNVAVVEAAPTGEFVTAGGPLEISATVRAVGPAVSRVAELRLDGAIREKRAIEVPANGEIDLRFNLPEVAATAEDHQGEVRITGEPDPLGFDDVRYFTFRARPSVRVLVISDEPIDGRFIGDAIDPDPTGRGGGTGPYRVDRIQTTEFLDYADKVAENYECVFVNNVASLSDAEWGKLGGLVRGGGGLVVGLGGRTSAPSYQTEAAERLLPAIPTPDASPRAPTTFGKITDFTHPLFNRYSRELDAMLSQVPISRYWSVTPREEQDRFSCTRINPRRSWSVSSEGRRRGTVLLWTTPLSRRADSNSKDAWNEFPSDVLGWSFWYLMDQTVAYLSGADGEGLNFEAGGDVALPVDAQWRPKTYVVQGPDQESRERLGAPATNENLLIVAPERIGHWTVSGDGGDAGRRKIGFSVNGPVGESQLAAMQPADLDKIFDGPKHYSLADDPSRLKELVDVVHVGREMFPWLMALILMIVTVETLLANRFYRESVSTPTLPSPRPAS